ncbi:MAG: HyaD/HybD family hydrogenase maturation endopeptidase [Alphaproteobacteria bacterium]|nr:HyaD/HybD family hydrogenase maturation endopeptidase [Alphaproteobacteria bacterium]
MNILVLGLGNSLLSDEGVGVRIVEALEAGFSLPDQVELVDGGTTGMELFDIVADRDCVIVADAVKASKAPGSVIRLENDDIRVIFETHFSPHQLGLSDLLAALRLVDKAPSRVLVIGVVPESLELGLDLSPSVAAGRDQAVAMIVKELGTLGIQPVPKAAGG